MTFHPEQKKVLTRLFNEGYDFCKRLPDNAPDQHLIATDQQPAYLYKGGDCIAVYNDGSTVEYKPVFNPQPPYNGPPALD